MNIQSIVADYEARSGNKVQAVSKREHCYVAFDEASGDMVEIVCIRGNDAIAQNISKVERIVAGKAAKPVAPKEADSYFEPDPIDKAIDGE